MLQLPALRRRAWSAAHLVTALLATACTSGPSVRADYDRTADFARYRTYGFVTQAETSPLGNAGFRSLALQAIQSAAAREMESRGYRPSPTPDLLLDFNGRLEERFDIESTPSSMYGPGWGYGGWHGAPWGGPDVTTRHYKVGTLVMDIVDREQRQSVYQGGVEGIVSNKMLQDPRASLTEAVAKVFEGYPFVAGTGRLATPSDGTTQQTRARSP